MVVVMVGFFPGVAPGSRSQRAQFHRRGPGRVVGRRPLPVVARLLRAFPALIGLQDQRRSLFEINSQGADPASRVPRKIDRNVRGCGGHQVGSCSKPRRDIGHDQIRMTVTDADLCAIDKDLTHIVARKQADGAAHFSILGQRERASEISGFGRRIGGGVSLGKP